MSKAEANSSTFGWRYFGPMLIIQAYLWFTVAVFAWGPWNWHVEHPWKVYSFLTAAHLALIVGYTLGLKRCVQPYASRFSPKQLINIGVWVSILIFIPTNLFRTGTILPQVTQGLENPGAAYDASMYLRLGSGRAPIAEYLRLFLGPALALPVPLGIYYWKDLSRVQRLGVVFVGLSVVAMFIAMGTNKAIADTVILIPWLVAAGAVAGRFIIRRRQILMWLGGTILGLIGLFSFFTAGALSRGGGAGFAVHGVFTQVGVEADFEHPLLHSVSPETQAGILGFSLYLTVGYQALALSLEEPWVPCYGIGNSFFLQRQAQRALGRNDLWRRSYPARLEPLGWDSEGVWSSIYPWIASDVSFPGTLLIVAWIGWLFARLWRDVIDGDNPFAVALFAQVVVMLFYFPANNQLMQSGEGLSAFFITLIFWWGSQRRRRSEAKAAGEGEVL